MLKIPPALERDFFRALNRIAEPILRTGLLAPRLVTGGLIVLETTGFKSGIARRTPLVASRFGRYVFVSTGRGNSSFWVKNLQKEPRISYYLGRQQKQAKAFVIMPGKRYKTPTSLPAAIGRITDLLAPLTDKGWAFAVLKTEA